MDWINDLSKNARDVMYELGNFGPTVHPLNRQVKGCVNYPDMRECVKCYYDSNYLRSIASGCVEVADWLDKRALAESKSD